MGAAMYDEIPSKRPGDVNCGMLNQRSICLYYMLTIRQFSVIYTARFGLEVSDWTRK